MIYITIIIIINKRNHSNNSSSNNNSNNDDSQPKGIRNPWGIANARSFRVWWRLTLDWIHIQKKHRCVRFFRPFGNCCYRRTVAPVTSSSESLAGVTSSTQLVWVFTTDSRSEHARNQSDRSLEILLLRLGIIRSNDLKIISVESASFTSSTAPVFTLGGGILPMFCGTHGLDATLSVYWS